MKYKTTRKEVMNGYARVYSVGYCELQTLLRYKNPVAYTSGQYGWNADIYDFGRTAIVMGYRPFGTEIPYETVRQYEHDAQEKYRTNDYEADKHNMQILIDGLLEELEELK